jgi:hypothetical protein
VKLGEVRVIDETRGTRTVVDAAGRRHYLMRRVTPADRKAAAERARPMREAALRKRFGAVNAGKVESNKEGIK